MERYFFRAELWYKSVVNMINTKDLVSSFEWVSKCDGQEIENFSEQEIGKTSQGFMIHKSWCEKVENKSKFYFSKEKYIENHGEKNAKYNTCWLKDADKENVKMLDKDTELGFTTSGYSVKISDCIEVEQRKNRGAKSCY